MLSYHLIRLTWYCAQYSEAHSVEQSTTRNSRIVETCIWGLLIVNERRRLLRRKVEGENRREVEELAEKDHRMSYFICLLIEKVVDES